MQTLGHTRIHLNSTDSTNSHAMRLLSVQELTEGTVFSAGFQTAGRGQPGKNWLSLPNENLLFSVILRPHFLRAEEQFSLILFLSLAVRAYLSTRLKAHDRIADIRIKWPNDIMVNGKKIAGMLIENQVQGSGIRYSVAGIGLNLNSAPEGTESLSGFVPGPLHPEEELDILLTHLNVCYNRLMSEGPGELFRSYESHLFWKDELHEFSLNGVVHKGEITGVNKAGKLRVRMKGGIREFSTKEIVHLR